jgi:hypothetical protein
MRQWRRIRRPMWPVSDTTGSLKRFQANHRPAGAQPHGHHRGHHAYLFDISPPATAAVVGRTGVHSRPDGVRWLSQNRSDPSFSATSATTGRQLRFPAAGPIGNRGGNRVAPFPRQVSVEELLLRATGDDTMSFSAISHRLRPERAGVNMLRLSGGVAAVVVVGCLTAFAATSKSPTSEQASPPPLSQQPAIPAPPTTTAGSVPAPVPASPVPATPTPVPSSGIPPARASPSAAPKLQRPVSPPSASAVPAPRPAVSCTVRYTITDSWPGGFTASTVITNTGGSTLSPWTLTWKFTAGQQITHGWNGEYSQADGRVTVHPASYNPTIAPSGAVDFGFNGSYASANPTPIGFALNGIPCTRAY